MESDLEPRDDDSGSSAATTWARVIIFMIFVPMVVVYLISVFTK
jgi:hypothetical protein